MHIRTRLLYLALSILIPAFLASAVAIWLVYDEQRAAQEKSSQEAAKSFANLVDKNFMAIEGQLQALAKSPQLAEGDFDSFAKHAGALVPVSSRVVVLSTLDGQQLINTRAAVGAPLPRTNPSLLRLRLDNPGQPVVSDLFIGSVAKKKDVAVDVPVHIDGTTKYRLAMGFSAAELQELIDEQRFPSGWIATITDRNGIIVARSDQAATFVGKRATDSMLKRIKAREPSGINLGNSLDGRPVVAFFHRAPQSGWTAVLSIPQSEIRKPAQSAAAYSAAILFLLLGVAIWVAHHYARRTAGPIETLRQAAELLGQGKLVQLTRTGLHEADSIGDALATAGAQLRQHNELLETRVAEAVAASEVAQRALMQAQKLEALGRLTGGIAHDFNNISQTLSSCLQLLRLSPNPARIPSILDNGDKAIRRATELTAQMRSFARVQDVHLEAVDLAETIHTVMPLLASSLRHPSMLRTELADDLWPVNIDRLQFELALLNLVINARDAMPRGGEIVITCSNAVLASGEKAVAPGEYVVVAVADQGTGIPAELLGKVLDPFFTTKPVDKGTGLGLPQAYGFASQAGGTLLIDSSEGSGTTVTMYLPRSAQRPNALAVAPSGLVVRRDENGTVLFVEDDPLVRQTVMLALEHAGFTVIEAASGDEALVLLEAGSPVEFVFSDVVMPGEINGVELARIVTDRYPHLHVVLASGHNELTIDLEKVKLIGKPYDVVSVVNMLVSLRRMG